MANIEYCPQCGRIIEFTTCDNCGFSLNTGYDTSDEIDEISDDNWACGTLDPND
jgi:hypothetical protein